MTTKRLTKKDIQSRIEKLWDDTKHNIIAMDDQKHNPQVALMIEKNKGYLLALEDIMQLCNARKEY
jgi:hypothetical protein